MLSQQHARQKMAANLHCTCSDLWAHLVFVGNFLWLQEKKLPISDISDVCNFDWTLWRSRKGCLYNYKYTNECGSLKFQVRIFGNLTISNSRSDQNGKIKLNNNNVSQVQFPDLTSGWLEFLAGSSSFLREVFPGLSILLDKFYYIAYLF